MLVTRGLGAARAGLASFGFGASITAPPVNPPGPTPEPTGGGSRGPRGYNQGERGLLNHLRKKRVDENNKILLELVAVFLEKTQ